jgi:glycosyltransferase involved in cell wall biosynthesis
MKVLVNAVMLSGHLGGIGQYTFQLLSSLRRARPQWKITLAISESASEAFKHIDGISLLLIRAESRRSRFMHHHLWLRFVCKRFDVLHSVGNIGMIACPIPQVITLHDSYENVSPERFHPIKRAMMRFLISRSGREAKTVIAVSQNTSRDISRFYPHLQAKVRVIYSGNRFPVIGAGPSTPENYFLFVGTLEPGKNLELLIRALATMADDSGTHLKVVGGQGWRQSHLPKLMESLNIQSRVDFLGFVGDTDLIELYRHSLALVLPSHYEGFGLPAIEAMACGCPALLADNSSLPEAGGNAALYFKTGDLDSLVSQMRRLRDDAYLREQCIERGMQHASRFRWDATAESTAICLEDACRS